MSESCFYKNKNIRKLNQKETILDQDKNENLESHEKRESTIITDICLSNNLEKEDSINLFDQNLPQYKLRVNTINSHTNNWVKAPFYIDENEIKELTNEQISLTLDYFIQSGYRVSQMTKTYYDIEAVTKLLDEKERDLEIAATIGKQLLEKDQQLEEKIEFLEEELIKTNDMVNQLRYEIQLKDNLLKSFIESEQDSIPEKASPDNFNNNQNYISKRTHEIHFETINEFKRKIEYLEEENDQLRTKAVFFEKETSDLELKESNLIASCFKELEESQETLKYTQDELKKKTTECFNQQEEIDNLFGQIFELQSRIKCLTKDNFDLQSIYETSKFDLIEQIREHKDKYNECIQMLNNSQKEISLLRRKLFRKKSNMGFLLKSSVVDNLEFNSFDILNNDDDLESSLQFKCKNKIYSPFMTINQNANNSSFAAEIFTTYHQKQQFLKISQSNEFIKNVKQKLIKTVPGTNNIESCFQSEDENLTTNQFYEVEKKKNCYTPCSIFSSGSSVYSNFWQSDSLLNLDKLQIVKPIEGSITLKHWQNLATPNFGCLFENRPGITIKGNSSETGSEFKEEDRDSLLDDFDHDGIDYFEISNKDFLAQFQNCTFSNSQLQLLTKILESEEIHSNVESNELKIQEEEIKNLSGLLSTMFFKPIKNEKTAKGEYSDPDTPPSSPINKQNNRSFSNVIDKICNFFKTAPTPPASPNNELVEEYENEKNQNNVSYGFFDQIVKKLKEFNQKNLKIQHIFKHELIEIDKSKSKNSCITPPPSPSRHSPPTPNLEEKEYTEDELKTSAFVTITKLNPLLNKQIDISSLLRSLSSLKKNKGYGFEIALNKL